MQGLRALSSSCPSASVSATEVVYNDTPSPPSLVPPGQQSPRLAATNQQASLIAMPVYESSPISLGVMGWYGYEEFISPGTSLPSTKSITRESIFDYISETDTPVCGCLPGARLRVDLAMLAERGIRKAKKEDTRSQATIVLQRDLTGTLTVRFMSEDKGRIVSKEVAVDFAGARVLELGSGYGGESAVLDVQNGSFLLLDRWRDHALGL